MKIVQCNVLFTKDLAHTLTHNTSGVLVLGIRNAYLLPNGILYFDADVPDNLNLDILNRVVTGQRVGINVQVPEDFKRERVKKFTTEEVELAYTVVVTPPLSETKQ